MKIPSNFKLLIKKNQIEEKIRDLAKQINADYLNSSVNIICILNGAFMFLSDLVKMFNFKCEIDFIQLSSYGNKTDSSGAVEKILETIKDLHNKNILIIEDIIDTGLTLFSLIEEISSQNPRSIRLCTFLSKPARRKVDIDADYVGFEIPDKFVVGYGLDYKDHYRNLPEIYYIEFNKNE